jgi:biotin--protein ligase
MRSRYAAVNLDERKGQLPESEDLVEKLSVDDDIRLSFLKACLEELGLNISPEHATIPYLSPLYLSSTNPSNITTLLECLMDVITIESDQSFIREENDTFVIFGSSSVPPTPNAETHKVTKGPPDYNKQIKTIISYPDSYPSIASTPYFDHNAFYSHLQQYQSQTPTAKTYGNYLLYGEIVTSTTTLLEK